MFLIWTDNGSSFHRLGNVGKKRELLQGGMVAEIGSGRGNPVLPRIHWMKVSGRQAK